MNRYDGTTGTLKSSSGSELKNAWGIAFGRDGDLFVADIGQNKILRYDGGSGAYKGVFASGGGLSQPTYLTFGPDGDLYVASNRSKQILRFDGTTGAYKTVFASGGELNQPLGLAFGPDGDLFATSGGEPFTKPPSHQPVLRFDGKTGAFKGDFSSGRQLNFPIGLLFAPDGDLYVSDFGSDEVLRFDGVTGVFKSVAASDKGRLSGPNQIAFTPAAKVLNVSTRLQVEGGDNVLIGGFIVTGKDPKRVIVRAIGPSLAGAGISGALADPVLELHDSTGAAIASNDNWRQTQEAEIQATGVAPSNEAESAIVRTLAPGNYTAVVRGKNDTTGIGVVEAYDLNQAQVSKLANISTRGLVKTGDNILIGGFIVRPGGGTNTDVVVRAIGPSLAQADVSGALQNPMLELHDSSGATIASNDDWKETQQAAIEGTGLQPKDDRESAILSSLPPGAYTAVVRGKSDTTGIAVVELYNIN
jgi:streptogramin lyase